MFCFNFPKYFFHSAFYMLFRALSNVCALFFPLFVPNVLLHMQTMAIFVPGQNAIYNDDGNEKLCNLPLRGIVQGEPVVHSYLQEEEEMSN